MLRSIQLFVLILLAYSLSAQQQAGKPELEDRVEATNARDDSRKAMLNSNTVDPTGALMSGSAFYISNPSPTYEVDMNLAYHNPEWQLATVRLVTGDLYEIKGRYRIIDQQFEVLHEGVAYELKKDQLQRVVIGEANFLMMPDPLLKKRGAHIYQRHYASKSYQVLEYHGAQWQDPPEQNMFDTREQHRTIKEKKELILSTGGAFFLIKRNKDVLKALGLSKKSAAANFIRRENLKVSEVDELVTFLEYLERGKSK